MRVAATARDAGMISGILSLDDSLYFAPVLEHGEAARELASCFSPRLRRLGDDDFIILAGPSAFCRYRAFARRR